jgi:hypothetical protein
MDDHDFSYEQKNSYKNTNSNTWDASDPPPLSLPPPNYHFTHAKVLGQLSEERVQEVGQKRQGQEIC